jgi:Head domain of trimeric autotransporter adhesin
MKQIVVLLVSIVTVHSLRSQNVGIGTLTPQAMLHVKDSNVLFNGPNPFVNYAPASNPPASGPGTRLMWYAQKGAFRAGWVEDNRWDKDSSGPFSIGLGHSPIAYNVGSVALGIRTRSMGFGATALGYASEANADYSFAAGYESKATQQIAVAIGAQNTASGFFSTAIGSNNTAANTSAVAIGQSNMARGTESVAIGSKLKAKARASFVAGWYNDTSDSPDPVFVAPTDRLFQIGNGNGFLGTLGNALTVLRNGNHGLGTVTPLARLHVADSSVLFTGPAFLSGAPYPNPPISGAGARTMWYPSKAAFRTGLVFGNQWDNDSIGLYSFAAGLNTVAKGDFAFALGNNNRAIGVFSFAGGSQSRALDRAAFAFGAHRQRQMVSMQ